MPPVVEQLSTREREILTLIADGSSDKEIAAALYLSINTVKWHNRQIYAKLGVSTRTEALAVAEKTSLFEKHPAQDAKPQNKIPHNLPARISSFVGREKEINQIQELLENHRLVTLCGPGGVGKTRLALQTANVLLLNGRYPDGILFIELAPVIKPEWVLDAIREGLDLPGSAGTSAKETILHFLKGKHLLLLLDNFEHLLEASQLVTELLEVSPRLTVLTTSRESLNLSGEQVYPVLPLVERESLDLFIQRALSVKPDFQPNDSDTATIQQICARLDNLPLAVELAATRMKMFSLPTLLAGLENRFLTLGTASRDMPERHQTLERAIGWSYDLLEEEEKTIFRRLGVFQGSRSIEAVEAVCCFDLGVAVLDGLDSLLSKNLIKQKLGLDHDPRFIMLETIQEFAGERLHQSGELQQIQNRHTCYFVELVEQVQYSFRGGPDAIYWLSNLQEDYENIRIIFERTIGRGEFEFGLRLVGGLYKFWVSMDRSQEGLVWVEWALEHVKSPSLPIRAGIYAAAGDMSSWFRDYQKSLDYFQEAIHCYNKLGNKREEGWMHINATHALYFMKKNWTVYQIIEHLSKGVEFLTEVCDDVGVATAWRSLGVYAVTQRMSKLVVHAHVKSFRIGKEIGDLVLQCFSLNMIGAVQLNKGRPEIAKRIFKIVLFRLAPTFESDTSIEFVLDWLGGAALSLGHPRRAVILLSAGDAIRKRRCGEPEAVLDEIYALKFQKMASEQMEETEFNQAWAEGLTLSYDEIVSFALEDEDPATLKILL